MYCYKCTCNFNFTLILWPRCSYLMFHPPLFLSSVHFNPLITSGAPPLPHTRSGKSGPCVDGQTGCQLAFIPIRIPL